MHTYRSNDARRKYFRANGRFITADDQQKNYLHPTIVTVGDVHVILDTRRPN